MHRRVMCIGVAAAVCGWALAAATLALADPPAQPDSKSAGKWKRPPLVVMKQADIRGRVFLLTEADKPPQPAPNIKIAVQTYDDGKLLRETASDDEGRYSLPSLDVGRYTLMVGTLKLELQVKDPDQVPAGSQTIPKTLLVFIPRDVVEKAAETK